MFWNRKVSVLEMLQLRQPPLMLLLWRQSPIHDSEQAINPHDIHEKRVDLHTCVCIYAYMCECVGAIAINWPSISRFRETDDEDSGEETLKMESKK